MVKHIAATYGCDLLTASILLRRGIIHGEEIRYFLEADLRHLRNPFELPGMEDAVDRILAAKEEGEKVLVFGDRDVDGITSTVLVVGFPTSFFFLTSHGAYSKVPASSEYSSLRFMLLWHPG